MSAIFSDTFIKLLTHAYIFFKKVTENLCWTSMTLDGWIVSDISEIMHGEKSIPKGNEYPLPMATQMVQKSWGDLLMLSSGEKNNKQTAKSFKSIRNSISIPLEGCWWNTCKPDTVPKEKVLKICKPVSRGVSQAKVPSWTQGPLPAQGLKPLDCLSDILHRHVNSSL